MIGNIVNGFKSFHFGECIKQKKELEHLKLAVLSLASERARIECKIAELSIENCELKENLRDQEANEFGDLPNGI